MCTSGNIAQRSVSYKPISPPEWCRLPSDRDDIPRISFQAGRNLPKEQRFILDSSSRCSCGATASSIDVHDSLLTIYTSLTAIVMTVETSYCPSCRNTKGRAGPDLGEYGVFNWNNRIAFSHELMNSYTSQFTTSETPMYAFHQTVMNAYLNERSPTQMCSLRTFLLAYFAFARLQLIESKMECLQCGLSPKVVIADGISVSFPKHRVENLQPPTLSDKSKAHVKLP
jgi:CxC4 like cysteine cluster associated with KDZ transposases